MIRVAGCLLLAHALCSCAGVVNDGNASSHGSEQTPAPGLPERSYAPRLLSLPDPYYPASAREKRLAGTTVVSVQIQEGGRILGHRMEKSSGSEILDRYAIETLSEYRFEPSIQNGSPASVWAEVAVRFPPRAVIDSTCVDESYNPVVRYKAPAEYAQEASGSRPAGETILKVLVLPSGALGEVGLLQSSGFASLDAAAAEAVRHSVFEPGFTKCRPVNAWMAIPYRFPPDMPSIRRVRR